MRDYLFALVLVMAVLGACLVPTYSYYGPGIMPFYRPAVVVRPLFAPRPFIVARPMYGRRW